MGKLKNKVMDVAKKNVVLRVVAKKSLRALRTMKYFRYYLTNKVDDKTIVFESFMGRAFSDSQKALYKEMLKDDFFKDYTFVWAFKGCDKYKYLEENNNTKVIEYGSKDFMKYMAKAKWWITNSRLPEYLIKKKSQKYIQCWHGTPLKRLGFDIEVEGGNALNTLKEIKEKYEDDAKRYDYMLSPSAFCTEKFVSAFNLKKLKKEDVLVELGYPRNDYLFNHTTEDVVKLKNELGIPLDKKVILYAPTWRDNQHQAGVGYTYDLNLDFDRLREKISDEYVIIFRTHYFVASKFNFDKYKGFIFNMSSHDDVNECYILSDIIITDYSSVFFDYANLKRPMLFYMYDLDEYQGKLRDFYFGLDELPGPIVKTQDELENEILNIKDYDKKYNEKYTAFTNRFTYLDSGDCSKRVIEKIFK
ncbi:MAG: CDP-glycerol glycerophosphotransferase family protein [Clostridia bacterium]|nr:CDP-glycerol glycerophosphotransferase family protein [Clostridia bacterium]